MKVKIRGAVFRIAGLVLGILATAFGTVAIVFSAIGMHQSHLCKKCEKTALLH